MAEHRVKPVNRIPKLYSCPNGEGRRHRGIKKKRTSGPIRRSTRLRNIGDLHESPEEGHLLPPSARDTSNNGKPAEHLTAAPEANARKRKRPQEPEDELRPIPVGKRPRERRAHPVSDVEVASSVSNRTNPIDYWRREGRWPKHYFVRESNMDHLLARTKSSSSLRRKRSDPSSATPSSMTPSDQKPREERSAPYRDLRYAMLLETKGSFMRKDKDGVSEASKNLCRALLEIDQVVPDDTLFRDDLFEATCEEIQNRNEAKVIQDIALLIVPSARHLAIRGDKSLDILTESVNEGWNNSIPLTGTRPQPDYSVGFSRTAFSKDQLDKLQPFIGDFLGGDLSFFMATFYMYFPFFTCEVKCGAQALEIADRQNAHSMTLAVRGVVEMFRRVKREKEVDREILAFSVSHDHRAVRIYGHYPVMEEKETKYYRYPIREFSFTELDGKEKWTAYKFTKNVYDTWMPTHFKRLCSVIDELQSEPDFGVPPLSEGTGLSQVFERQHLPQSDANSVSLLQEDDSQTSRPGSQDPTPNTSFSQPESFKKPRTRRAR
ncbi:MAG: hypothetical protein M1825_000745 [Sarcosagium campestre]|nr:MAG: hypothetical protein M1825_000745 [Sarcosagium campestre]